MTAKTQATKSAPKAIPNTKATPESTAKLEAVRAKGKEQAKAKAKAEKEAAAATAAALAKPAVAAIAKPKASEAKPKGKGGRAVTATVGVAAGALDGQPHTKAAVQAARKAELDKLMENAEAEMKAGKALYLRPNGTRAWLVTNGSAARGAKGEFAKADDVLVYPAPTKAKAQPKAKPEAKTSAPKGERKASAPRTSADRTYRKGAAFTGKAGTWTEYMVRTAQQHTSTAKATAAHKASGRADANKPLDFKWMEAKGFIVFA